MKNDNSLTPEEKLLRLIKGQNKSDTRSGINNSASTSQITATANVLKRKQLKTYQPLSLVRGMIAFAFIASSLYLAISLLYPMVSLRHFKLPIISLKKTTTDGIPLKTEKKSYDFYSQNTAGRKIFTNQFFDTQEKATPAANVDLLKDLSLIGIVSGDNPQAIIEDKKIQKTYYLSTGQFIGELKLEEIQEGKIILNYKGEHYELYL